MSLNSQQKQIFESPSFAVSVVRFAMLRLRLCTRHVASFRAAALAVNVALPSTTSQAFNPAGGFIMGGFSASIAVQPKRSCS